MWAPFYERMGNRAESGVISLRAVLLSQKSKVKSQKSKTESSVEVSIFDFLLLTFDF